VSVSLRIKVNEMKEKCILALQATRSW
jgi:hypothetical protein